MSIITALLAIITAIKATYAFNHFGSLESTWKTNTFAIRQVKYLAAATAVCAVVTVVAQYWPF